MKLKFPWRKIQLINAAKDLAALKLWEQFGNMDFFVVETPLEDPVLAAMMGEGGEEFGICIFRGPDAFGQPLVLEEDEAAVIRRANTLGFGMEHYRQMGYGEKKWYKSANYRARKDDLLPAFVVKRPGDHAEYPEKDADLKLLLFVIKGVIAAHQRGEFMPTTLGVQDGRMLTLQVSGEAEKPTVHVTQKTFAGSAELIEFCNRDVVGLGEWTVPDLSDLPRLDETWVLVTGYAPAPDNEDKDEDIEDTCLAVVAHAETGEILKAAAFEMDIASLLDLLVDAFNGYNTTDIEGLPRALVVADPSLFAVISAPLADYGIAVSRDTNHPVAADIWQRMKDDPASIMTALADDFLDAAYHGPDVDLSVVPAPDDLAGWKAVSQGTANRLMHLWNKSDLLRQKRPSQRFFGDWEWEYYIESFRKLQSLGSYVVWGALCYRKSKKDATYVEELLADDPPAALRAALEALSASYPSLYQIVETNPDEGTLTLKDLLLGNEMTVHDYGLSKTAQPHCIGCFRVSNIGNFHFVDIAGPPFGPLHTMEVLDRLKNEKLPAQPTPQWLRENAHIFGRLWDLYDDIAFDSEQMPRLTNTDGDPLVFITAQFGYSDPTVIRRALKRRDDFDYDEDEDIYIWFKEGVQKGLVGDTTLLGRIYFQDGFLKAEVNSAQRLDGIRELLEEAGAVYHTHESQEPAEAMKEARSKPASLPIPEDEIPEEVRKAIEEKIKNHYIDWLDSPIPALKNKTPRQAVKTAKGAQQVRIMIETIPTPNSSADIQVPKQQMLKELGLNGV